MILGKYRPTPFDEWVPCAKFDDGTYWGVFDEGDRQKILTHPADGWGMSPGAVFLPDAKLTRLIYGPI